MTYSIILDFWMDIHLWEDFWTSNITIQSGCRPAWLTRTSTDTFHCKLSSLSQILTCIFLHRCNWQPRTSISHGLVWSQNNEYVTQFANRRLTVSLSYQTKRPYVVSCVSQKKHVSAWPEIVSTIQHLGWQPPTRRFHLALRCPRTPRPATEQHQMSLKAETIVQPKMTCFMQKSFEGLCIENPSHSKHGGKSWFMSHSNIELATFRDHLQSSVKVWCWKSPKFHICQFLWLGFGHH